MNFFKNLLGKKDTSVNKKPTLSYSDFWTWFMEHEKAFHKEVNNRETIEKNFFDPLSAKLAEIKDGYFFLVGMLDNGKADLVLTADGNVKNFVFVEELVKAAPNLEGWAFTALKPAMDIEMGIRMGEYEFSKDQMSFCYTTDPEFPDNIDITIIHDACTEENKAAVSNGCYIFLDNYLGELNFATTVDDVIVCSKKDLEPGKEMVPIEKLKDYLIWREKEFVEKYEGVRRGAEKENYSILQAEMPSGNALIAVMNMDLLNWERKASHPWILEILLSYDGKSNRGMPDKKTVGLLDEIEDQISGQLKDVEGYLNVGRQTADSVREIYFACKDFRKPSKVLYDVQQDASKAVKIDYQIYKDKYWRSFDRFRQE